VGKRTLVIVNPRSRNGATGRRWNAVERKLLEALGPCEVEQTRAPRHAQRLAREGVRAGVERVVVAGGDGTVSEVVSGLLAADLGSYAQIGLLPLGTGGDLARTLHIPADLDAAIACIAHGRARSIDAGRATYTDDEGLRTTSHFLNVASLGISGRITQLVNAGSKALGGTAAFLAGTVRAIARYRGEAVTLRLDGRVVYEGRLVLAAVANGSFFGGGMHIAPDARPDDGKFDVVFVGDLTKWQLLSRLPSIYRGRHLGRSDVGFHRGAVLEADADPGRVRIELDGESVGSLPARFEVVPGAVTVLLPAP
jgi:YegS/Rv2252/BmrU family lipid kinase